MPIDLQEKSAPPPPPPPPPQIRQPARERAVTPHLGRGWFFTVSGVCLMIVAPVVGLVLAFLNPLIGGGIWVGLSFGAAALLKRGKHHRARGAVDVLAHDPRPPVLYLRSFGADDRTAQKVGQAISIRGVDFTVPTTEEEQIAKVASRIGPLVAIGRPDEALPSLGAARMYVADDQWQARVLDMIGKSSIILMRAGKTEGFFWEVGQVVKHNRPDRLIWLVPFSENNFRIFAERANTLLPKPLPLNPGPATQKVGSLYAWIWFESDWTPHIERPVLGDKLGKGAPVACLLHRALNPVFRRIGHVSASLRNSSWPRVLAFLIDLFIVSAFGALVTVAQLVSPGLVDAALVVWLVAAVAYFVLLDLGRGTVGKRVMKIAVVDRSGEPIGTAQALARGALKCLLIVTLPITALYGFVSVAWSTHHRMPHDMLTRTYVIDAAQA
ncbi:MAG: RDD family protein [Acidobacteriaceae bacterium]|jgi:uncharacterized RDD family membrane protein YckC